MAKLFLKKPTYPPVLVLLQRVVSEKVINNDLDFAEYLLEDHLVAVIPGVAFSLKNFIRVSYATSQEQLEIGCNSIVKACEMLS